MDSNIDAAEVVGEDGRKLLNFSLIRTRASRIVGYRSRDNSTVRFIAR